MLFTLVIDNPLYQFFHTIKSTKQNTAAFEFLTKYCSYLISISRTVVIIKMTNLCEENE